MKAACPHCNAEMNVPAGSIPGKLVKCPYCNNKFVYEVNSIVPKNSPPPNKRIPIQKTKQPTCPICSGSMKKETRARLSMALYIVGLVLAVMGGLGIAAGLLVAGRTEFLMPGFWLVVVGLVFGIRDNVYRCNACDHFVARY